MDWKYRILDWKYRIRSNFRMGLFTKILKITSHFRKYNFEIFWAANTGKHVIIRKYFFQNLWFIIIFENLAIQKLLCIRYCIIVER